MNTSWKTSRRAMLGLAALVLSAAATQVVLADGGSTGTRLRTKLAGAAIDGKTPYGSAEFRMDSPSRTRLEVEVENVNLPAATLLDVVITHSGVDTTAGQIKLSSLGSGELELDSQKGQIVPPVVKGDTVTVKNAGAAILAGAF